MAIGIFNMFDKDSKNLLNGVLLQQNNPYYNLNCLKIAAESESKNFLSLPSVQKFLNEIWIGKLEFEGNLKTYFKVLITYHL